jgi:hypothetical protein
MIVAHVKLALKIIHASLEDSWAYSDTYAPLAQLDLSEAAKGQLMGLLSLHSIGIGPAAFPEPRGQFSAFSSSL